MSKISILRLKKWCKKRALPLHHIYSESISGTINPHKRELGEIIKKAKKGDILIVTEISRLGRSILQIMSVLNQCMEKGITIHSIKENYELGDNINSKVLAFAFGLSAEIERHLISQRTKEALFRIKCEGKKLGRPKGITPIEHLKLYPFKDEILRMRQQHIPLIHIAQKLKVNRKTLSAFLHKLTLTS